MSRVPMRDGVELGADVYLPPGDRPVPRAAHDHTVRQDRRRPRSLPRTSSAATPSSRSTRAGLRASKGKWEPYIHEAQDGYDVQQWVGEAAVVQRQDRHVRHVVSRRTRRSRPRSIASPNVKALVPDLGAIGQLRQRLVERWHPASRVQPCVGDAAGSDRDEPAPRPPSTGRR